MMSLTWILCLLLLMIIPSIMVYAGYMRQNHCTKLGAKYGYTTRLSLSSAEAWAFAQSLCPKRYMISGAVLGIVSILLMLLALDKNSLSVCIYSVVVALLQLLVWGIVLCTVESRLRKMLGIKEE